MNPYEIIEKYYTPGSELYNILIVHSEQVTRKALALAERHPELNIDTKFVAEAAMLHDIGIFLTDADGIKCFGTHAYIEHGYLGADLLRQLGFPRHARVCERHTGTGLSMQYIIDNNLPLPHKDLMPETIEEQLICYADKFFSKTKLNVEKDFDSVRAKLAKFGEEGCRRFDRWHTLFD